MAAQNIMLRAHDLGLATSVIRSFNQAAVRELVEAPEHVLPELLINIGYPVKQPSKLLDEVVLDYTKKVKE